LDEQHAFIACLDLHKVSKARVERNVIPGYKIHITALRVVLETCMYPVKCVELAEIGEPLLLFLFIPGHSPLLCSCERKAVAYNGFALAQPTYIQEATANLHTRTPFILVCLASAFMVAIEERLNSTFYDLLTHLPSLFSDLNLRIKRLSAKWCTPIADQPMCVGYQARNLRVQ
jgi:hypothetical protein